ncbi:CHAT domain-containing protein [Flavivirga rizhaonensis]|uniref:Tetratricopeptide repeat protein n=1 Tax=Flavivirga rizhaonensis TaxID=2559571 RepID=A0A4S1E431_9FLAO|nr:CHAT domain-containing tetratricopeptide repeat protein [Flavivirga rizhaonensis]TGV04838.1 tetratricopeptide repeat protein [Flavivirga rizhaonensis]
MKRFSFTILSFLFFVTSYSQQIEIDENTEEFQEILSLYNKAKEYKEKESYDLAITTYKEVIRQFKGYYSDTHQYYCVFLSNLASLYESTDKYNLALPLHLKSLEKTEQIFGKEHSKYGICLNDLALFYMSRGQLNKALFYSKQALTNISKSLGKENSAYGIFLNNLALLYEKTGQFDKAMPLYKESLENTEKTLGKDHSSYGTSLNNLANLYQIIGEYDKALSLYLEALKITEITIGKDHSSYGISLNNLANLYQYIGEYSKALPLLLEALENIKKTLGKNHSSYGKRLNNLANFYQEIGQYEKAMPLYQKALENQQKTLGKNHPTYIITINNLALLYKSIGQFNKALTLYHESLEVSEKTLGKEHPSYGIRLNNLALAYESIEQYSIALSMLQEGLKNSKKSLGKEHPSYGKSLNNLALVYESMEQNDKALSMYIEVLENTKRSLGKEHSNYIISLNNLISLYQKKRQYSKVLPLLIEANIHTQSQIKKNFAYQTREEKEKFIRNKLDYNLSITSNFNYLTNNSYPETISLATNNILTTKNLLLNATKNILNQLEKLNDTTINKKVTAFRSKETYLNKQLQLPIASRVTSFNKEQSNLETLEREIVNLYTQNFGEDVNYVKDYKQTKLKGDELAIEFTYFDIYNKTRTDSTIYVAYLYKKDWETPKVIDLFEEQQLTKYFNSITSANQLYKTRGSKSSRITSIADSIYQLVWQPLEKFTKDSKTIYYSPDGFLHKIPFAALPNEENKLLGEVYELNQMGNTADIKKYNKQPNLKDIVLIGGVDYTYTPDSNKNVNEAQQFSILESELLLGNEDNIKRSSGSGSWSYLNGTKQEVNRIKELIPQSKVLNGKEATETAFKNLSGNSPSVLHIATHGYFFPDLEKKKDKRILGEEKPYVHAENPLLRSGLILANANYAWKHGNNPYEEEDGILTALEISNLDLKKTDIVILSACETGLGDIPSSEGVYGLQRAFKMAGVNIIIMTLWEVSDKETAEFMDLFYTKWKAINNPKKAFKEAQSVMMEKYRKYPEKWAAFVLFE